MVNWDSVLAVSILEEEFMVDEEKVKKALSLLWNMGKIWIWMTRKLNLLNMHKSCLSMLKCRKAKWFGFGFYLFIWFCFVLFSFNFYKYSFINHLEITQIKYMYLGCLAIRIPSSKLWDQGLLKDKFVHLLCRWQKFIKFLNVKVLIKIT